MRTRINRGYSLIELMITIAIVGIVGTVIAGVVALGMYLILR